MKIGTLQYVVNTVSFVITVGELHGCINNHPRMGAYSYPGALPGTAWIWTNAGLIVSMDVVYPAVDVNADGVRTLPCAVLILLRH